MQNPDHGLHGAGFGLAPCARSDAKLTTFDSGLPGAAFSHASIPAKATSVRRGPRSRGGGLAGGTAIATFDAAGRYENDTSGRSHAAILIKETGDGLWVWDQWPGQPVHQRLIRFRDSTGLGGAAVDDGDAFHAIVLDGDPVASAA